MNNRRLANWLLEHEARALLSRLDRVRPYALSETMVPAASLSYPARTSIERHLAEGRSKLKDLVRDYLAWLRGPGRRAKPDVAQRSFTILRLRFNVVLTQFDLFSDVLSQRSEHRTGVWLAGLDMVATDALSIPGGYFPVPPTVCYMDRGMGAAIRRARTRLPGGGKNPVAIIRVPRERMIGAGVASSLVHEAGHQGVALLDILPALKHEIALSGSPAAQYWHRWISEIVADLWSVARVGVTSTLGLMGVVSLPRAFVFRMNLDDPHPFPWIRVKLSCAIGQALYPHPQWAHLSMLWEDFYPKKGLPDNTIAFLTALENGMSAFIDLLLNHKPVALKGYNLRKVLSSQDRQPTFLLKRFETWLVAPQLIKQTPPCLIFAALGQARMAGHLSPEKEGQILADLLTHWALRRSIAPSAVCNALNTVRAGVPVH